MNKLFKTAIILFLLFEIIFSFERYFYFPLDGDLPAIALPNKNYQTVLHDPFAMNVLLHDSVYSAPNRFFTHWSLWFYFKNTPLLLQHVVSPLDSIYYACALAKTMIQFFIIYLLAIYITGKIKFWNFDLLLAAAIIAPLLQISGYNFSMGIIDHSITYTFFYALALGLVLLFFLPFLLKSFFDYKIGIPIIVCLVLLAFILSLNGPLNAPLILIICPTTILIFFFDNFFKFYKLNPTNRIITSIKNISPQLIFIFGIAILCCSYSFYIGRNNSENLWTNISLHERYERILKGLYSQFTTKLGPSLLLFMILINFLIIRKKNPAIKGLKLLRMIKWSGFIAMIYILLLPLGGYRSYRPNIIKMDTISPVMLGMILFYGMTTWYIIKEVQLKRKNVYFAVILIFSGIFFNADASFQKYNSCERNALEKIARSPDKIVFLDNECPVMSWERTTDYRDSETKTELLYRWNVTTEKKLFYQK